MADFADLARLAKISTFATVMIMDMKYMRRALQLARLGEFGASPNPMVGAVIVDDATGRIAGEGFHRRCGEGHAEVNAVADADRRGVSLDNTTLYVTLEPCPMCAGAIMNSRFSRLVYGASDEKAGVVDNVCKLFSYPTLNHHTKTTSGICSQDCLKLLRDFFEKKRKKESSN